MEQGQRSKGNKVSNLRDVGLHELLGLLEQIREKTVPPQKGIRLVEQPGSVKLSIGRDAAFFKELLENLKNGIDVNDVYKNGQSILKFAFRFFTEHYHYDDNHDIARIVNHLIILLSCSQHPLTWDLSGIDETQLPERNKYILNFLQNTIVVFEHHSRKFWQGERQILEDKLGRINLEQNEYYRAPSPFTIPFGTQGGYMQSTYHLSAEQLQLTKAQGKEEEEQHGIDYSSEDFAALLILQELVTKGTFPPMSNHISQIANATLVTLQPILVNKATQGDKVAQAFQAIKNLATTDVDFREKEQNINLLIYYIAEAKANPSDTLLADINKSAQTALLSLWSTLLSELEPNTSKNFGTKNRIAIDKNSDFFSKVQFLLEKDINIDQEILGKDKKSYQSVLDLFTNYENRYHPLKDNEPNDLRNIGLSILSCSQHPAESRMKKPSAEELTEPHRYNPYNPYNPSKPSDTSDFMFCSIRLFNKNPKIFWHGDIEKLKEALKEEANLAIWGLKNKDTLSGSLDGYTPMLIGQVAGYPRAGYLNKRAEAHQACDVIVGYLGKNTTFASDGKGAILLLPEINKLKGTDDQDGFSYSSMRKLMKFLEEFGSIEQHDDLRSKNAFTLNKIFLATYLKAMMLIVGMGGEHEVDKGYKLFGKIISNIVGLNQPSNMFLRELQNAAMQQSIDRPSVGKKKKSREEFSGDQMTEIYILATQDILRRACEGEKQYQGLLIRHYQENVQSLNTAATAASGQSEHSIEVGSSSTTAMSRFRVLPPPSPPSRSSNRSSSSTTDTQSPPEDGSLYPVIN